MMSWGLKCFPVCNIRWLICDWSLFIYGSLNSVSTVKPHYVFKSVLWMSETHQTWFYLHRSWTVSCWQCKSITSFLCVCVAVARECVSVFVLSSFNVLNLRHCFNSTLTSFHSVWEVWTLFLFSKRCGIMCLSVEHHILVWMFSSYGMN